MNADSRRLVVVSQRIDSYPDRNETRDALDQRLGQFLLQCGLMPVPVPTAVMTENVLDAWMTMLAPHSIVLSGGNDIGTFKSRDDLEMLLVKLALERNIPLLGICRGMQVLVTHLGGTIRRVQGHVSIYHEVKFVVGGTEYCRTVNSYHGYCVQKVPSEFVVIARSSDGIVEAIRHKTKRIEAWMWHPEREHPFHEADLIRARRILSDE